MFPPSKCSDSFWLGISISSVICRLPLLLMSTAHYSMPNFIPLSQLDILIACFRVSSYFFSLRVFHISVSWWFSTGDWVTASLLKSPGLFSAFWRSQQCCYLDGLLPSHYFWVLQSLYQSFGDYTKSTNYNWYHRHFHVPQFFLYSLARSRYLSLFQHSCNFTL